MTKHHVAGATCPACGTPNDAAASTDAEGDRQPAAGDFGVCVHCSAILCFTESLELRLANDADLHAAGPEMCGILLRGAELVAIGRAQGKLPRRR